MIYMLCLTLSPYKRTNVSCVIERFIVTDVVVKAVYYFEWLRFYNLETAILNNVNKFYNVNSFEAP